MLQLSEGKLNYYLNVYFEFDVSGELDLNRIARELTVYLMILTAKSPCCCSAASKSKHFNCQALYHASIS